MNKRVSLLVSNVSKDDCEIYDSHDVLVGDTTLLKLEIKNDRIISVVLGIEKIDDSGQHFWDEKELEVLDAHIK